MGIDNIWLFVAAGWLLNLTPGPDVLFIVANGARSARAGLVAALGITAGCFVHIAAAAIGVSALIATSSAAFTVLKWLGAAYLIYMGLGMLWHNLHQGKSINRANFDALTGVEATFESISLATVFKQGFWTNALNPKVAFFFLAFLPQFISPDAPHKTVSFVLLGLLFNVNALPVNVGYALAAAWLSKRMSQHHAGGARLKAWLQRCAGAMFVYFGVRLALSENRP